MVIFSMAIDYVNIAILQGINGNTYHNKDAAVNAIKSCVYCDEDENFADAETCLLDSLRQHTPESLADWLNQEGSIDSLAFVAVCLEN